MTKTSGSHDTEDAAKSGLVTKRVALGAATGIGSAALIAALLYARRSSAKPKAPDARMPAPDPTD